MPKQINTVRHVATRPQIIMDTYGCAQPFKQGDGMPPGGNRTVFSYSKEPRAVNNSGVSKPELGNKVI